MFCLTFELIKVNATKNSESILYAPSRQDSIRQCEHVKNGGISNKHVRASAFLALVSPKGILVTTADVPLFCIDSDPTCPCIFTKI